MLRATVLTVLLALGASACAADDDGPKLATKPDAGDGAADGGTGGREDGGATRGEVAAGGASGTAGGQGPTPYQPVVVGDPTLPPMGVPSSTGGTCDSNTNCSAGYLCVDDGTKKACRLRCDGDPTVCGPSPNPTQACGNPYCALANGQYPVCVQEPACPCVQGSRGCL